MRISVLKIKKLLFEFSVVLILSVSFLVSAAAQSKEITEEEFETVKNNATQKLKNISYRSVTMAQTGRIEKTQTYEFVPPDREHFIFTQKSPEITTYSGLKMLATNFYDEWIYIGEKIFYRNGANKNWEETGPNFIESFGGSGNGAGTYREEPTVTTEYKLTPNQFVNQQNLDLYEKIISRKYSYSAKPSVDKYKYWINKNGLFVKTQSTWIAGETTVDYEYNSNLKIEAPLIKKRGK